LTTKWLFFVNWYFGIGMKENLFILCQIFIVYRMFNRKIQTSMNVILILMSERINQVE